MVGGKADSRKKWKDGRNGEERKNDGRNRGGKKEGRKDASKKEYR